MSKTSSSLVVTTSLLAGAALLALLSGCETDGSARVTLYGERSHPYGHTTVVYEDDYDYYPGYEVYYSRNRREYVYRDGGNWVRRPQPTGVSLNVLMAAPSVRVDFRDSPERHHDRVVRSYPRNWNRPGNHADARVNQQDNRRDERVGNNDDRRDDHRDGRKDEKKNKKDRKDDDKDDRKDDKDDRRDGRR